MIDKAKFSSHRKNWNCFSKIDILGEFEFYTLAISLDSLNITEVDGVDFSILNQPSSLSMSEYSRLKKVLTLATHEFTHYLDGTASLWGMEHLTRIDEAAKSRDGDENSYFKLKSLYDYIRRLRLPTYYSTVEKDVQHDQPWKMHLTGGREFRSDGTLSDRPILFGRFLNAQSENIARSPISILSLLETSAMAQELEVKLKLASRLDDDSRIVELAQIKRDSIQFIYNKNLTEYSVCAHLVANSIDCPDLIVALRMSAIIARFVLNSTSTTFDTARQHLSVWSKIVNKGGDHAELALLRHALKHRNHGALFYIIALMLPRNSGDTPQALFSGFSNSLNLLGIAYMDTLAKSEIKMRELAKQLAKSELQSLKVIAVASALNFTLLKGMPLSRNFERLSLPPVFLSNMESYQFGATEANSMRNFDLEASYEELISVQIAVENFAEACL
ncbi:hypothetical protein PO883_31755 [Massilia sp. DJPM01]|uniref:hypothetical protein n=1 Tax=Massilia sp. DJPM01 TaxID=3024404 RepID=UPI00259DDE99|nr:hypothetical protein [Massilia sp. DJPM01]MDM5181758.1 hypothetical protein [Massilia sp. DJPM01]